jgi:hypothetical protein
MKLNYDNLEDAKTKLVSTYCLYKGRAVSVKQLEEAPDGPNGFKRFLAYAGYLSTGRSVTFYIDDPDFNCSDYNIGYLNTISRAAWFYRIPMKQWKQGLRSDQVRCRYSNRMFGDITFNGKGVVNMLENIYPTVDEAAALLREQEANIVAFHKNFALTYDRIHNDFILEYKGVHIGHTSNDLKTHKLMAEYEHLAESLKEVMN